MISSKQDTVSGGGDIEEVRANRFERPELFRRTSTMELPERRLHRIDNRIAEREVLLLRSANCVFLAGISDADGGMIGGHGNNTSIIRDYSPEETTRYCIYFFISIIRKDI